MRLLTQSLQSELAIGDVAKICGIPAHTIRFWEKEFASIIAPMRTLGKQRRYSDEQIQTILKIKKLLWVEKFSIQGARRILTGTTILSATGGTPEPTNNVHNLALQIARFLSERMTITEIAA